MFLHKTKPVDAVALALVNAVRKRADTTTTVTAATSADLVNAILPERRIELLGEGFRSTDILRLLQTIPAKGYIAAKTPGEQRYIWPISSDEMCLNRLMTDN